MYFKIKMYDWNPGKSGLEYWNNGILEYCLFKVRLFNLKSLNFFGFYYYSISHYSSVINSSI